MFSDNVAGYRKVVVETLYIEKKEKRYRTQEPPSKRLASHARLQSILRKKWTIASKRPRMKLGISVRRENLVKRLCSSEHSPRFYKKHIVYATPATTGQ